jgi:hypothetical protein
MNQTHKLMLNLVADFNDMEEVITAPKRSKEPLGSKNPQIAIEQPEGPVIEEKVTARQAKDKKPVKKAKADADPKVRWWNDGRLHFYGT